MVLLGQHSLLRRLLHAVDFAAFERHPVRAALHTGGEAGGCTPVLPVSALKVHSQIAQINEGHLGEHVVLQL